MIFDLRNGQRLQLGTGVLAQFRAHAQHEPTAPESGGILIGRVISDTDDVIIDEVTTPKPMDVGTRFTFDRLDPGHQADVSRAWKESGGTAVGLGNWHTHAERFPRPSQVDLDGWRLDLREWKTDQPALLFVIVGQVEVRVWMGSRSDFSIKRLELWNEVKAA